MGSIFVLKIKGIAKIPGYVQIRDANFTLIAYFRLDRVKEAFEKEALKTSNINRERFETELNNLPFGTIKELPHTTYDNYS